MTPEKSENVREYEAQVSELMKVTHRLTTAHDALTVAEDRRLQTSNIEDRLRTSALRIAQVSRGVVLQ